MRLLGTWWEVGELIERCERLGMWFSGSKGDLAEDRWVSQSAEDYDVINISGRRTAAIFPAGLSAQVKSAVYRWVSLGRTEQGQQRR